MTSYNVSRAPVFIEQSLLSEILSPSEPTNLFGFLQANNPLRHFHFAIRDYVKRVTNFALSDYVIAKLENVLRKSTKY